MKMKDVSFPVINISVIKENMQVDSFNDELSVFEQTPDKYAIGHPLKNEVIMFVLCLKGTFEIELNQSRYVISQNDLFVLMPDTLWQFIYQSPDFKACFIVISRRFLDSFQVDIKKLLPLFFYIMENPQIHLNDEEVATLTEYYSMLKKKVKNPKNSSSEIVYYLAQALAFEINDCYAKRKEGLQIPNSRRVEIAREFTRLVIEEYDRHRDVSYYADRLYISPKHLSVVMKDVSGETAGEWITSYVILQAKVLLKTSNLTIQQISQKLNFANQSFFGKYFKRYTGMTPNEYRTE
ncbi:AraC family transcriptional regulator [Coprobacter tertius]|uniref:Helix-turn-helix transcriptional regulator n=1 Tax=Coprobacter tertius TaxID=2944915 RepID=A0ABT1MIB0_9BACT|nr:helix-turn-helix domain-containing protein [Coprobacter tertius]MCP9611423.1 helix-turn-helix transcriptional regulator [Coprobacter tertius]